MFKFYCKGYMLKYLTTLNRSRRIPIKSIYLKISQPISGIDPIIQIRKNSRTWIFRKTKDSLITVLGISLTTLYWTGHLYTCYVWETAYGEIKIR